MAKKKPKKEIAYVNIRVYAPTRDAIKKKAQAGGRGIAKQLDVDYRPEAYAKQ